MNYWTNILIKILSVCPQQKSDAGGDDVEIPMENEAFMDDFFAQVWIHCLSLWVFHSLMDNKTCVCTCVCVCVLQAEDIRTSIDKIDESVVEIKKLYSTILSAPTSDQSQHLKNPFCV